MIPKYFFLAKGVGRHSESLQSFELALRGAGIQHLNVATVSSIIPPGCRLISKRRGLEMLKPGEIVFAVWEKNSTGEPHRLVAASIGVATPRDGKGYGYLSEYCSYGETEEVAGDYAEELASAMLATIMGVEVPSEESWKERRELLKASGIETTNITQSATGDVNGLCTTVVAAAVFIL
ncbi:MAG: pyruvoyl-dependent arginine decarboxylase [Nitrososphaeria archaeon]|nr:pyruvoyl-dependent arginine decarboxylase [Nitrososphaeria archaeon]